MIVLPPFSQSLVYVEITQVTCLPTPKSKTVHTLLSNDKTLSSLKSSQVHVLIWNITRLKNNRIFEGKIHGRMLGLLITGGELNY